jgi:5,10-methylene-tetrahydrofolate dehydrogenase/methenyl tetrahydrofolate cyclohydrolase
LESVIGDRIKSKYLAENIIYIKEIYGGADMNKVGIEKPLSNVKRYLESRDCTVEVLEDGSKESRSNLNQFDAIVVSGADSNFMGMEDIMTTAKVINAEGKTEDEIYSEVLRAAELKKR